MTRDGIEHIGFRGNFFFFNLFLILPIKNLFLLLVCVTFFLYNTDDIKTFERENTYLVLTADMRIITS